MAAAVIERDGRILIGQRKRGSRHSLKWEFPGGKVEPGETPRAALAARTARGARHRGRSSARNWTAYDVRYPGGTLTHLLFFRVTEFSGEPRNLEFEQIVWESRGRLASYDFLEGDLEFLQPADFRLTAAAERPEMVTSNGAEIRVPMPTCTGTFEPAGALAPSVNSIW